MIEVNNLSRRYGEFNAVDAVNFSIASGEVVGLLGHNGAGKTTIMKMLTGYLQPSGGTISIDGINVLEQPDEAQAQMGYLPENLPIYPELTVIEYLAHACELRGIDPAQAVPQAIARTTLESKAMDAIHTLSRGFKQRVGVAQAILHEPKFLILDEPSNGLDPNQIQQMRQLILDLAQHATVILSTHIMQEVSAVCDRVLILSSGRVVIDEQLDALQQRTSILLRTAATAEGVQELVGDLVPVAAVDALGDGGYRVHADGDLEAAGAAVVAAMIAAGNDVYEMRHESRDLEQIFGEVSATEVGHAA
ncbi:MAG: ABC transporter ATP-binding protein [Pseudomonadota bacterium]